MGSRARDRQPGGALRRGAVERTPTPDEDAAGRRAIAGAVARTPQRARGQGRHRRRWPTSHPDVWVRSSSAGGSTPGRSGSPLDSGAALAVGRKRRGGSAENVGSRTFGGWERSQRARRQRSAATRPRSAPLRAVAGGVWAGARTHDSRDGDAKRRAAKRGRIRASSAHRSFSRIWARDFLGRKSRRKRSAAERRAPSLPFFYNPSLFREPACGRAARAVSQSEAARVDEDSKKGKIRAPFLPVGDGTRQLPFSTAREIGAAARNAAASAARRSAGPCGWAAAVRPDTIIYGIRGRGRRTSTRPARRDPRSGRLGRRVRRPAERQPRPHRSARRRTARGAAREADGSGDDRTQGRAAAPPAGGRRRRARSSGEDPKTKTPRRKRDACLVLMREFAARTAPLYPNKCLSSMWTRQKKES